MLFRSLSEAFSLLVDCTEQADIDRLWERLGDGGSYNVCGWLKDRYGLSWQIVPTALLKYLGGQNREGAARAMQALLGMTKLDIAALSRAYEGG